MLGFERTSDYLFSVCIVYWHSNKTHVMKHNLQVNRN